MKQHEKEPMKPIDSDELPWLDWRCPVCYTPVKDGKDCKMCEQKIDWSKINESV